ncbi:MAG TPA: MoaD/ThiS family protein [Candidatus Acetothermia bacterium]|nr:MoaD/ThiS family protein [Candidatus Acetothermia bacterium]
MTSENEIKVTVRLFAAPREFLGKSEIEVTLSHGARLSELIERLSAEYPGLAKYLPYSKLAVNHALASPETALNDRDEVALLPPVGGG